MQVIFHYMKTYEYIMQPPNWSVGLLVNATGNNKNGVWPVARLEVVRRAHKINGNSLTHFVA
jgi:hypothetical protein